MKRAVLLLSMGGPDSLAGVRPFLFNLFNDPAILRMPSLLRWPLAHLLSFSREKEARKIYEQLGGKSPLTDNTFAQARALEDRLNDISENQNRVFVGMLYAPPFVREAVATMRGYDPDEIVLLPLYPQYSTTTSEPALKEALKEIRKNSDSKKIKMIDRFPLLGGLIDSWVRAIKTAAQDTKDNPTHILFSAHGLPEKIVREGDPYPQECQALAQAIAARLDLTEKDWTLCYQSRVGPVRWIGPSTEDEIRRHAQARKAILVAPIAFVCDHSETLYEIDHLYREKAKQLGAPAFATARPPATEESFINDLAAQIEAL